MSPWFSLGLGRTAGARTRQFLGHRRQFMAAEKRPDTLVEPQEFTPVHIPLSNGGHIAGKAWGNPKGHPVLGLHGWLHNAASFDKIAPLLDKNFYFVSIDLAGHGQSSHRPQCCRLHFLDYLVDVRDVIKGLGWEKFSFLCHSMGAGVASLFAAAQPDLVKNMVLIENIGVISKAQEDLPRLMGKALNSPPISPDTKVYETWDKIVARVLEGNRTLDKGLTEEGAEILARRGTIKVEGGYKSSRDIRLKEPSLLYMSHEVSNEFIKAVQCPTLLIIGKDSVFYEGLKMKVQKVASDNITVVEIPGGHHLQLYKHQTIAPLASQFILSADIPPGQEFSRV